MGNRKFGRQIDDRKKPLDIYVNPNGTADHIPRLSDDAFWAAVDRYLEDWKSRPSGGSPDQAMYTESIIEIILEQMR